MYCMCDNADLKLCVATSYLLIGLPYRTNFSLVGMLLPENIRRISTFRAKSKFSIYFSGSCIPTNESFLFIWALPTLAQTVQDYLPYNIIL